MSVSYREKVISRGTHSEEIFDEYFEWKLNEQKTRSLVNRLRIEQLQYAEAKQRLEKTLEELEVSEANLKHSRSIFRGYIEDLYGWSNKFEVVEERSNGDQIVVRLIDNPAYFTKAFCKKLAKSVTQNGVGRGY